MATLTVCVATHCAGCAEARRLAELVRARYTGLEVEIVDLDARPASRPPNVFAVPSYLLDGRLVSLGNPRVEDLIAVLDATLLQRRERDP